MKKVSIFAVIVLSIFFIYGIAFAEADDENCMLCHKYPGLTRVNKEGYLRVFYVDQKRFSHSVHSRIKCTGCHADITQIPHKKAKHVDCTRECHIKNSATVKPFSHKKILATLKTSIHNPQNKYVQARVKDDFPSCTSCHSNPVFRFEDEDIRKVADSTEKSRILRRCAVCHDDKNVDYKYFFNHVTHRVKTLMPSEDVVVTCTRCHARQDMVKRHKLLNAGESYFDTFHGKAVQFGLNNAPSCIDCHVKKGASPHTIMSHRSPDSATYEPNRYLTCEDSECHQKPRPEFGKIRMHVTIDRHLYPIEYYTALAFTLLTAGVFYLLLVLMIFELIRDMFPGLSLRRKKNRKEGEE